MSYFSIKDSVTCIIPFYNEDANNLLETIEIVLKVKEIKNIILVDDGSKTRETFDFIEDAFWLNENIKMMRLSKNYGKSFAVKYGLSVAFSDNVILLDADLKNIDKKEISNAISKFKNYNLEMLILRRVNSSSLLKLIRADTLLSGERIIKKKHLRKILSLEVNDYQLEVATNQYFIKNNLEHKCRWSSSSAVNNYKFHKMNFFKGILKDLKMHLNLVKYIGIRNSIRQILEFCTQEA